MSTDVEEMLRKMPLRKPSTALNERISHSRPGGGWFWKSVAASAAVAASVAAVWLTVAFRPDGGGKTNNTTTVVETPPVKTESTFPLRIEQNFSDVQYEGIFLLDENTPLRQYRRRSLRRVQWIDQKSGCTMEMEVPDQRVILVTADAY